VAQYALQNQKIGFRLPRHLHLGLPQQTGTKSWGAPVWRGACLKDLLGTREHTLTSYWGGAVRPTESKNRVQIGETPELGLTSTDRYKKLGRTRLWAPDYGDYGSYARRASIVYLQRYPRIFLAPLHPCLRERMRPAPSLVRFR
jgi:hypothetical protein